jgi:hypothetical protein
MSIFFKIIVMIVSMVYIMMEFMIGNTQKHICAIQRRHITKKNIVERGNGKIKGTTLGHHHMGTILLNPTTAQPNPEQPNSSGYHCQG